MRNGGDESNLEKEEKMDKENIIVKLSFEFALEIIAFAEMLEEAKKFVVAKQILKSGTSIGANISEAQHAESKHDFIHKLKIAAKEMEETEYWLLLCQAAPTYPFEPGLIDKLENIRRVINKIIITSKNDEQTH